MNHLLSILLNLSPGVLVDARGLDLSQCENVEGGDTSWDGTCYQEPYNAVCAGRVVRLEIVKCEDWNHAALRLRVSK